MFKYVKRLNITLDVHGVNKVLLHPEGVGDAANRGQRRLRKRRLVLGLLESVE